MLKADGIFSTKHFGKKWVNALFMLGVYDSDYQSHKSTF